MSDRGRPDRRSYSLRTLVATILYRVREYKVDEPLARPRRRDPPGRGRDAVRDQGLPVGFKPGTTTTITAKDNLEGNLLTLGNGSNVRKARSPGPGEIPGRPG